MSDKTSKMEETIFEAIAEDYRRGRARPCYFMSAEVYDAIFVPLGWPPRDELPEDNNDDEFQRKAWEQLNCRSVRFGYLIKW